MQAKTILIADDEPDQVATLEQLLTQRGYKVLSASNGVQALSKAADFQPHLIILDIMMPKMDGTQVAMLLKQNERTRDIPIFFITAVISSEDRHHTTGHPNSIFAKPVKLDELLEAIHSTLANLPSV